MLRQTLALTTVLALGACAARAPEPNAPVQTFSARDVDCLARAMYFESIRSSRDGMIAVGSVVMNRVEHASYPASVCGVVGQRNQFAPGVLSRQMRGDAETLARTSAVAVLRGERHPLVGPAKFFHAATYNANFNNMHYVVTAGGNAFYERRRPAEVTNPNPLPNTEGLTGD